MAHHNIFREELAISYPGYGFALWEPGPGDNMMPSKWAMSVSFARAISSACSMFYILETILLIGIPLLSRKIMNNCGLSPVILSGVKSVRVLDKVPIISTQKM